MRVEIRRKKIQLVVHATKVSIQVYPLGTVLKIGDSHYPLLQGESAVISEGDEGVLVENPDKPKSKYKQGKLDL